MAKATTTTLKLHFAKEKDTPGTVRFFECDEAGAKLDKGVAKIGTLYVQKAAFNGAQPERISMEVTF